MEFTFIPSEHYINLNARNFLSNQPRLIHLRFLFFLFLHLLFFYVIYPQSTNELLLRDTLHEKV